MKFIITVDTEADNQWEKKKEIRLKNIAFLSRFQALCEKYNFKPTYLLSYEVAEDKKSVDLLRIFQDSNKAEIGSHLHPWTNPPYKFDIEYERRVHRFPHELDEGEIKNKLESLTDLIEKNFLKRPTSFRGGRWSIDDKIIRYLKKLGYKVDSSITPKISWQGTKGDPDGRGGLDYSLESIRPHYWANGESILEVPMTILFTSFIKEDSSMAKFYLALKDGFIKKVIGKLFFRVKWLRIFSNTQDKDFKKIYRSAELNNLPVIVFMIHSSELMPAGSPYAKTEQDVEFIYKKLESMFECFSKKGAEGITLTEFAKDFS